MKYIKTSNKKHVKIKFINKYKNSKLLMKLNRIMCNIKLCRQTNKKFVITNLNKIEQKLIKLLIKINIIHWCKKEYKSTYTINFNLNNKINVKTNFKNKIFLKKNTNKLIIASNDTGVDFLKKNKGGIALCLIHS